MIAIMTAENNEKFHALEMQIDRRIVICTQHLLKRIPSLHGFTVATDQPYVTF